MQKFDKDDKPFMTALYVVLICLVVIGYGAFTLSRNSGESKKITNEKIQTEKKEVTDKDTVNKSEERESLMFRKAKIRKFRKMKGNQIV